MPEIVDGQLLLEAVLGPLFGMAMTPAGIDAAAWRMEGRQAERLQLRGATLPD